MLPRLSRQRETQVQRGIWRGCTAVHLRCLGGKLDVLREFHNQVSEVFRKCSHVRPQPKHTKCCLSKWWHRKLWCCRCCLNVTRTSNVLRGHAMRRTTNCDARVGACKSSSFVASARRVLSLRWHRGPQSWMFQSGTSVFIDLFQHIHVSEVLHFVLHFSCLTHVDKIC